MTDKCEFCKGTGKEPGEDGCVWCFSTGTKEGQKLSAEPEGLVSSAAIAEVKADFEARKTQQAERDALPTAVAKFREAFVIAVGNESPFAKLALAEIDAALSASAEPSALKCETCKGNGVVGWTRGQTPEQFEQGEDECGDCFGTGNAHNQGMAVPGTCTTCKGLGTVPDGEIAGLGGVEFENGPVECIKDCPDCKPIAPVERDERAEFESWYIRDVGIGLANLSRINSGSRAYEDEDAMAAWEGWQARAALERKP